MRVKKQAGDVMLLAWYHGEVISACLDGKVCSHAEFLGRKVKVVSLSLDTLRWGVVCTWGVMTQYDCKL